MPSEIGTESAKAVKAANCCGVKFFLDSMLKRLGASYIQIAEIRIGIKSLHYFSKEATGLVLHFKLIPNTFHGSDAINAQFLPYLTNMYINGSVANDHFRSPDLVQDFIPEENFSRF